MLYLIILIRYCRYGLTLKSYMLNSSKNNYFASTYEKKWILPSRCLRFVQAWAEQETGILLITVVCSYVDCRYLK